jgi:hypothetical protein
MMRNTNTGLERRWDANATLQALLDVHLLDRLLDELNDHLSAGPELVRPACEGVMQLLQPT